MGFYEYCYGGTEFKEIRSGLWARRESRVQGQFSGQNLETSRCFFQKPLPASGLTKPQMERILPRDLEVVLSLEEGEEEILERQNL